MLEKVELGRDYKGKSGNSLSINIAGAQFLDKLTFGVFEKIGCFPKTKEECYLVARVFRNRLRLDNYYLPFWKEMYDIDKFTKGEVQLLEEAVDFFEHSEGLDLENMG